MFLPFSLILSKIKNPITYKQSHVALFCEMHLLSNSSIRSTHFISWHFNPFSDHCVFNACLLCFVACSKPFTIILCSLIDLNPIIDWLFSFITNHIWFNFHVPIFLISTINKKYKNHDTWKSQIEMIKWSECSKLIVVVFDKSLF